MKSEIQPNIESLGFGVFCLRHKSARSIQDERAMGSEDSLIFQGAKVGSGLIDALLLSAHDKEKTGEDNGQDESWDQGRNHARK